MSPLDELPMRIVGQKHKTTEARFAEIQRHGRLYRRPRRAKVEVLQSDGTWVPYVRPKRAGVA